MGVYMANNYLLIYAAGECRMIVFHLKAGVIADEFTQCFTGMRGTIIRLTRYNFSDHSAHAAVRRGALRNYSAPAFTDGFLPTRNTAAAGIGTDIPGGQSSYSAGSLTKANTLFLSAQAPRLSVLKTAAGKPH